MTKTITEKQRIHRDLLTARSRTNDAARNRQKAELVVGGRPADPPPWEDWARSIPAGPLAGSDWWHWDATNGEVTSASGAPFWAPRGEWIGSSAADILAAAILREELVGVWHNSPTEKQPRRRPSDETSTGHRTHHTWT